MRAGLPKLRPWRERRAHRYVRLDRQVSRPVQEPPPLLFDEVAELCPAGIVVISADGQIRYSNPRAQQMLGLSREQYQQRDYNAPQWRVTDFDGRPQADHELAFSRVLTSGAPVMDVEHAVERADGSRIYLRVSGQPVRDAGGRVQQVIFTMLDVSAAVLAEHAKQGLTERFQATLEAMSEGVVLRDGAGVIRYCNASAQRILGLREDQLVDAPQFERCWRTYTEGGREVPPEERPAAVAQRSGQPCRDVCLRLENDAGRVIWILMNAQPLFEPGASTPYAVVSSFADITQLKQGELALRRSEQLFANALEHAPIGMAIVGLDGRWLKVNQAVCQITGYPREELERLSFQDITHPDDLNHDLGNVRRLIDGEIPVYQMTKRYIRKDRSVVSILLSASVLRDEQAKPVYFVSQIIDLSEQHRHEAELQRLAQAEQEQRLQLQQQALYRAIINASPLAKLVVDGEGCIIEANVQVGKIFGHRPEALVGKTLEVLLPKAARQRHAELRKGYDREVRSMGARRELYALHADGHEFPVEVLLSPLRLNDRDLTVASVADITEQRAAAQRLRQSEARWRELANSQPQLVWTCAPDGSCDYLSQRWMEYTGLPLEPQLGSRWIEQVHPEDRAALQARWQAAVAARSTFVTEFRIRRHDGVYHWFDTRAEPLLDERGEVLRWIGSNTDIEARKQAEQQLHILNATLENQVVERTAQLQAAASLQRAILTNAGHSIIATRVDGIITLFNPAAEQMLGYTSAEMVDRQTPAVIHDADEVAARALQLSQELQQPVAPGFEVFVAQARRQSSEEREWTYVRRDGSRLPVRLKVSALRASDGTIAGFLGIAVDLTEQRRREVELRTGRQRLEDSMLRLQQQHRDMTVFTDFSGLLQACITLDEIQGPIRRYGKLLFPQCAAVLYLMQPSRNHLERAVSWGEQTASQPLFEPQACWGLRRGQPHVHVIHDDLCCTHTREMEGRISLCVPMVAQNDTLGLLYLEAPVVDSMTLERIRSLAQVVSERIGMTVANLRLRDSLRQQSIRDTLTQLYNRRYLEETVQRELAAAQRAGSGVAVLMIDVDHFKQFNDRHGHEAGDQALRALARQLEKSCRQSDIACRYGGEEFTLVLIHVTPEQAQARAQELCDRVRTQELHLHGQPLGRITISIGVALFPQHGEDLQALKESADRALYRAKHAGRDRVLMSEAAAQS